MKIFRSLRILLLALAATLIPVSSFGGVFISVNFAPPLLPVYEQPLCPEPGLIWTPGYWAYDEDGYYWVPGAWVPSPYVGALWTPPYWGWDGGLYVFHPGYWGMHVGYYGGVNYGFGYMGVGFVGGMWRGNNFMYNTAVMRVDDRYVRNVYVDRDVVRRYTIDNDRRVSYSGGRDGIRHDPTREERFADRDRHFTETRYQQSNQNAARSDKSFYARNNGGRPSNAAVQRPLGGGGNSMPDNRGGFQGRDNGNQRGQYQGNLGGNGNPRSNTRNFDNRNTYTPPNANNQNRNYNPQQGNPGDFRSNTRNYDNRNTYTPPPNVNNQDRGFNAPRQDNRGNDNAQPGRQYPQYGDAAPRQNNPAPQVRNYNNPHAGQDNMQNRGGAPQQRQAQPQQQQQQQQQQRENQGGRGDRGNDRQR